MYNRLCNSIMYKKKTNNFACETFVTGDDDDDTLNNVLYTCLRRIHIFTRYLYHEYLYVCIIYTLF